MSWLWIGASAWAAQLEVPADYSIQEAIDAAQDGDEIAVQPGLYEVALDMKGKTLRLFAVEGPENTVLKGTGEGPVLVAQSGEGVGSSLEGFTVVGGRGRERIWIIGNGWMGGGVYVHGAALSITGCVFRENQAVLSGQSGGAALFVMDGDVWVQDSVFERNLGFYAGGAALVTRGNLSIQDSEFVGNHARRGGAIAAFDDAELLLSGNDYAGNVAGWGGAVFAKDSRVYAEGEWVYDHQVWRSGGAWALENSVAELDRAEFADNSAQDDGGHLYLAQGSQLQLRSSRLDQGQARAGGAMFVRGTLTSLVADGLFLSANQASEAGGDLWIAGGRASLSHFTSMFPTVDAAALGALVYAKNQAQVEVENHIVYGGAGGTLVELAGGSLSWGRGLVYGFVGAIGGSEDWVVLMEDPTLWSVVLGALDPALREGSPAIDAGREGTLDLDGSRADLGATGGLYPYVPLP